MPKPMPVNHSDVFVMTRKEHVNKKPGERQQRMWAEAALNYREQFSNPPHKTM